MTRTEFLAFASTAHTLTPSQWRDQCAVLIPLLKHRAVAHGLHYIETRNEAGSHHTRIALLRTRNGAAGGKIRASKNVDVVYVETTSGDFGSRARAAFAILRQLDSIAQEITA